jgi:DNA-3-methyladenine glycosylase II
MSHKTDAARLIELDSSLAAWIHRVGPLAELKRPPAPFHVLTQSIVSQQISNKASATILARLHSLPELGARPAPGQLLKLLGSENGRDTLASCGLSRQKLSYLESLAVAFDGPLGRLRWSRLADQEVIDKLIQIKGIGVWTAEMFLIFGLRRPDVFSAGDLALRAGVARVYHLEKPTPKECAEIAERWRPYRSLASRYLWRIAHFDD